MAASQPQRIGLYGGTFDPIHHGHLILGRDAVETLGLDRLIFIPAAVSPHKLTSEPGATGSQRLAMLIAALVGEEHFAWDGCELHRNGPSFTVDTVKSLRAQFPVNTELFYLIGEDNVAALHTWHRIGELNEMVRFVVFRREEVPPFKPAREASDQETKSNPLSPPSAFCLQPSTFPVLHRSVEISSTEIRNRVASGQSIRYLVPEAVAGLIEAQQLYRHPLSPTPTPLRPPQQVRSPASSLPKN